MLQKNVFQFTAVTSSRITKIPISTKIKGKKFMDKMIILSAHISWRTFFFENFVFEILRLDWYYWNAISPRALLVIKSLNFAKSSMLYCCKFQNNRNGFYKIWQIFVNHQNSELALLFGCLCNKYKKIGYWQLFCVEFLIFWNCIHYL